MDDDVLGPNERNRERDEGIDVLRMRAQNTGHRECQGQAMANGKSGDHEHQIARRRDINTRPSRKDMWSTPVKMCMVPMRTNSKKRALSKRLHSPPVTSTV